MIDFNQVDVGSYVKVNQPYKDAYLTNDWIAIDSELLELLKVDPSIADPIPLSKLVLAAAGFKEPEPHVFVRIGAEFQVTLNTTDNSYDIESLDGMSGTGGNIDFKNLHELQEFYERMTGEELEINL